MPRSWRPYCPEPVSWGGLAWSIIPGLGHLSVRQYRLGWALLGAWIVAGLLCLVTFPSRSTPSCVMLLALIHSVAITTFFRMNLNHERLLVRLLFGLLIFATMYSLVYGSVGSLLRRIWTPLVLPAVKENPLLRRGDGLIYEGAWRRSEAYGRGDLVVYDFRASSGSGFMASSGVSIDRIVGVPGDHFQIRDGGLLINGRPPAEGQTPLAGMPPLAGIDVVLNRNQYAIIPSLVRFSLHNMREFAQTSLVVIVPVDMIRGRVLYRCQPWSRRGALQ